MKHNLNDPNVRTHAVDKLKDLLGSWHKRRDKIRKTAHKAIYDDVIFAVECALQALGADPDAP